MRRSLAALVVLFSTIVLVGCNSSETKTNTSSDANPVATSEAVAARWESSHPVVACLLEEGIEDCLACLAFPMAHRVRIRSTNGLERLNEEIRRRTRVVCVRH